MTPTVRFQTKTGSEYHTTNRRSVMVLVNGQPIYKALKPLTTEWELVGNKGNHGKYAISEYEIPVGAEVRFTATANGEPNITHTFTVTEETNVDYEGYYYGGQPSGWIVTI